MSAGTRTGIATVLIAAAVASASCSQQAAPPASDDVRRLPVTVTRVTMAGLAERFEAGGVVQARTTAAVTARILAPVREVRVAPGDRVRAGQTLVVLDARDLGAQARSARAAAAGAAQGSAAAAAERQSADAALALARATHTRISSLAARRSATAQELDEATAALRAAEARAAAARLRAEQAGSAVDSARASSDAAGATASFAVITAPFAGLVTEKLVEPGNMAAPGMPLLRLEDTRGFRLEVRVDESRARDIAPGAPVDVALDAGDPAATITGRVEEVSRAVDADTRAFVVKIALPQHAGLRSGTFGRARFTGAERRALAVPAEAIVRHGQVTSVFVVENGVARVRLVSVRGTEVLAGLADGDVVILSPPAGLADGRAVAVRGR